MFMWRKKPHSELGIYVRVIKGNQFVNINWHIPEFSSVWGWGRGREDITGPGAISDKINSILI